MHNHHGHRNQAISRALRIVQLQDGRWLQVDEHRTQEGGIISIYTDITELKRRERELAEARDRAMEATPGPRAAFSPA